MDELILTPILEKEGKDLDTYRLIATLADIEISVGSIHILRSVVEKAQVTITFQSEQKE